MRRTRLHTQVFALFLVALGCGSESPSDSKAHGADGPPPSAPEMAPGQKACAAAKEHDTVLAWLRVRTQHPEAPCQEEVAARIAGASKTNAAMTDGETPLVMIDEDGIWFWSSSETKPTIPHPPGSAHEFGALARSTAKYTHEHPEQSVVRVWAASEVTPADLLGLVETLRGPGCEATSKATDETPPGCLLWRPVVLGERPALEPSGEATPAEPAPTGPPSNQPCGATFECPEGEECLGEKEDKNCRPATADDCKSYWRCETDGYCTLINGRCLLGVKTDADCKKRYGNRAGGGYNPCSLGACRAVGGDCVE